MELDVNDLPHSPIERLVPVIRKAQRAGCLLLRVKHTPAEGFSARVEWHGGRELEAGEFRYLLGHVEQTVFALTP